VVVDPNEGARALARELGAHEVTDRTDDLRDSAYVVLDFVGEQGAEKAGFEMTRRAGSYYVIGYGGTVDIPTIDLISTERNVIGNLVGSYNDLDELMTLAAQGKVTLHTRTYPLTAVNEAIDDLEAGRLRGRGILVP
jgi:NAD+-dependent secondary alcohol dehydrogenase Adh1